MSSFAKMTALLGAVFIAGTVEPVGAKQPTELAGTWILSFDKTGASCRVMLQADKSDAGDYFLGMPTACRHAMPGIAAIGRWAAPDDTHLTLDEPGGKPLLTLTATTDGYIAANPVGTYALRLVSTGRSAAAADASAAAGAIPPATPDPSLQRVAARQTRAEPAETTADLAGRYAVMREKRDTGCMVTLDKTHAKGGERAQLAPGCRDQGIVIFDPSAWQIIHGDLVLTARAGHKTKLEKQEEGLWAKDPKEGGKPLGLKKL